MINQEHFQKVAIRQTLDELDRHWELLLSKLAEKGMRLLVSPYSKLLFSFNSFLIKKKLCFGSKTPLKSLAMIWSMLRPSKESLMSSKNIWIARNSESLMLDCIYSALIIRDARVFTFLTNACKCSWTVCIYSTFRFALYVRITLQPRWTATYASITQRSSKGI